MANFFYFDQTNQKQGPVSEEQLKELATQGLINPNTPMETDTGHQGTAGQIPGIFPPNPFAASTVAPAAMPVATTTIRAKNFRCNGCGASLEIPKNPRGHVKCTFCGNDCVLDGLIKNAEIADKENISSGIPLTATPAQLHRLLIAQLSESPYIPLDVFDKVEVVREERHCVPAFQIYCSGSASFTYQVGRRETRQEQGYKKSWDGDTTYHTIKTIEETKWTPMSSSASVSESVFAPGVKKVAVPVQKLYTRLNATQLTKQLVDIDELAFPANVETHNYNLPKLAAFEEYARPRVEAILEENARKSLKGHDYLKDFLMGGGNLQHDATRVFLGLYRIVYKCDGKEYSMWATGDGKHGWLEGSPIDPERKESYDRKKSLAEIAPEGFRGCGCLSGIGFVIAALSLFMIYIASNDRSAPDGAVMVGIVGLLFAGLFFIPLILRLISQWKHNTELEADKAAFEAFDGQRLAAGQKFKEQKKALRGIYEKATGDASAF